MLPRDFHTCRGIAPVADYLAGTVNTDVVTLKNYNGALFHFEHGVGLTGTSTLTMESCDDVTPTTVTAVPFYYRVNVDADLDVWTDWVLAAATGYLTIAGSDKAVELWIGGDMLSGDDIGAAAQAVEAVNSPVLGFCTITMTGARYPQAVSLTALT